MTASYWGAAVTGMLVVACGTQRSSSGPDQADPSQSGKMTVSGSVSGRCNRPGCLPGFAPDGSSVPATSVTLHQTDGITTAVLPDGTELEFIFVDAGAFRMGSPDSELGRWEDEGPQHDVELTKPFYLGRYEVTQMEWASVTGTTPWEDRGDVLLDPDSPAVHVTWTEVQDFIAQLNAKVRDPIFRLPTEAEWEYACRGGTTGRWSFGDEEALLDDYAWHNQNSRQVGIPHAHVVGAKLPNPLGLYDMHGNVREFTADWYAWPYWSEKQIDPTGPEYGPGFTVNHATRGGYFRSPAGRTRSASRSAQHEDYSDYGLGLRLAMDVP